MKKFNFIISNAHTHKYTHTHDDAQELCNVYNFKNYYEDVKFSQCVIFANKVFLILLLHLFFYFKFKKKFITLNFYNK